MKKCPKCEENKKFCEFRRALMRRANGAEYTYIQSWCKACESKYRRIEYNWDTDRVRELRREHYHRRGKFKKKDKILSNREDYMYRAAKIRASKKGIEFNISIEDITIPRNCPLLGIELDLINLKRNNPNSPSLDRIDSTKGYIKGNVWVISSKANVVKNDLSLEELETFSRNTLSKIIEK